MLPRQVTLGLGKGRTEASAAAEQAALAEQLYAELAAAGLDVLFDERDMSPGIKFKDADLLGCPAQVVAGKRAPEGLVELKDRASGERRDVPVTELAAALRDLLSRG